MIEKGGELWRVILGRWWVSEESSGDGTEWKCKTKFAELKFSGEEE